MKNENSRVNEGLPTYDGTADRSSGRENIGAADENESPPREDAAETTRGCTGPTPRLGTTNDADDQNAIASGRNGDKSVLMTDGGQVEEDVRSIASDLTKFQIRCLATLVEQDRYGLGIKKEVETYYGVEQNHGRLFPNLDQLEDLGLLVKGERDRRTNNYTITELGRRVLQYELGWLEDQISGGDGE